MGIYRLSNGVVSGIGMPIAECASFQDAPDAVACAVLSARRPARQESAEDTRTLQSPLTLIHRSRLCAGFHACPFRRCAAVDFRRSQKSLR